MGSNKNKKNSRNNTHRHTYKRKKLPGQVKRKDKTLSDNDKEEQTVNIEGSRIINIEKLRLYTDDLAAHATRCEGSIILNGETRDGLASILTGHCSTCKHTITLVTSKKVKGPRGYRRSAGLHLGGQAL